jgi:SAM-dependent methyltransferase
LSEPDYVAVNRDTWTKANREFTDARAHDAWSQEEITWGMAHAREARLQVLPDVEGKDVVELGCGTAYFGAWLKKRGARRVVGVDVTPAQLETARRMDEEFGLGLELVEANAEETGLAGEQFDLVLSEYGASIWCDPYKWIPEAARLLRPGGELVFLRNSTLSMLCATEEGPNSETLQRPQRGLHRLEWEAPDEGVEFQLGHGDWFRLLRENGFQVLDLIELYATEETPYHTYYAFSREWSEKWPLEEIWHARLAPVAGIGSRRAEPGSADAPSDARNGR